MEFRVLGPLEVVDQGRSLSLGGTKQRALLAVLLLHAGEVVPTHRLIEDLWGEAPPETAAHAVQVYVAALRKLLEPNRAKGSPSTSLRTRAPGYLIEVGDDELDLARFERLIAAGRAMLAADPTRAASLLGEALSLWRGPALADLALEPFAQAQIAGLEERRIGVLEDRIEADLAAHRHADLVGELERLVAAHPLRERLWGQLILALYRSGRQAEALEAYQRMRERLAGELGIDPSRPLQQLERAILVQDPGLDASPAAAPAARPAAPGPPPSVRLPSPPTPLIGRSTEVAAVAATLRQPEVRLVTLTGTGGIGKTRLAVEVASGLAGSFADGVHFVPLASVTDPDLVLGTVAASLDVREGADRSLPETLAEFLRDRRVLLVLDNFEQVVAAATVVADLLEATRQVKLLVTSRTALRIRAEHEHAVPPLTLADLSELPAFDVAAGSEAVELFVARARAVDAGFALTERNAAAVAEICTHLDGLPLAIELAAARTNLLSPTAMLARLEHRLELLTGGPRDLPARQQTLRATLDWSYGLLEPAEQRLFARLAVFVDGWRIEAALEVCGETDDADEVLAALGSLMDKSLLRRTTAAGQPRFRMLATVREYALERLRERGEAEAMRRRHSRHFLALAEEAAPQLAGPGTEPYLRLLEEEYGNLRAAVTAALEHAEPDVAARIAVALRRFWVARGHMREGRAWLHQALASGALAATIRARASSAAGCLAYLQDDYVEATALLEAGLALSRDLDDRPGVAFAACWLGGTLVARRDLDRAAVLAEEALAVARELDDDEGLRQALDLSALAADLRGEVGEARRLYEECLALARRHDDGTKIVQALACLAIVGIEEGDHAAARRWGEEGLALARTLGDTFATRDALLSLGLVAVAEGDPEGAARSLHAALRLSDELAQRFELATCLKALGAVAALRDQPERAVHLFAAGKRVQESFGAAADVPPIERDLHRHLATARALIGEEAFAAAWSSGLVMSQEDAVAYALRERSLSHP
jgi:predicted ATPase/DNA-binding SARP family transcriptional activator